MTPELKNPKKLKESHQLNQLQQHFKAHLMQGDASILQQIVSTENLSNKDRMGLYGNAYYARLVEVLEKDYEAIHTLLGDDEFNKLCLLYINLHPSKFPSLRWFGQYMSETLKSNEPYASFPYLVEMAIFEWRFTDAFDAETVSSISEAEVAQVPVESWPELVIGLHPSVSWFKYQWNILPVWKAATDETEMPELKKLDTPETCVIWRQDMSTKYRTLEPNENILIQAVAEKNNFSQLCELLIEAGEVAENVPMITAGFLKSWLALGMVVALEY